VRKDVAGGRRGSEDVSKLEFRNEGWRKQGREGAGDVARQPERLAGKRRGSGGIPKLEFRNEGWRERRTWPINLNDSPASGEDRGRGGEQVHC
jgi:hypothetical protein